MADGRAIHGKNAYIYLSGIAICGANAWSLTMNKAAVEVTDFCNDWNRQLAGKLSWSGNITAWQRQDEKVIINAVQADGPVALFIYPDRGDNTNFFNGMAIFTTYSGSGSTESAVGGNGDFVGDSTLSITGFA